MPVAFAGSVEKESGSLATGATTTQTTGTWTPLSGDVIVVKVTTKTNTITAATPTMTGVTFTSLYIRTSISGAPAMYLWVAQVTGTPPGTVAVSCNITNSSGAAGAAHIVAERYTGAALPPSAVGSTTLTSTSSSTAGLTVSPTQAVAGSMLSWTIADGAGVSATPTYSTTTSTPTASQNYILSGVHASWSGYQGPISTTGQKTVGIASFSAAGSRKLMSMVVEIPPAPLMQTCTESFKGAISATKWPTRNNAGYVSDQSYGYVNCSHTNGTPSYAALRTAPIYQLDGSWLLMAVPMMPWAVGDSANFQFWAAIDPAVGVNRVGFEYIASTNTLVMRGQTTNYAAIGTDVSVPYNRSMQWLRLALASGTLTWQTSPDGFSWTTRRTMASAPSWTAQGNLMIDIEGFRSSGLNNAALFDYLNLPNSSAAPPRFVISSTGVGQLTWAADETKTDVVSAGYQNANYNRQTNAGNGDASGLAWPVPIVRAPWGRTGERAALLRLPDGGKRNEIMPNVPEWNDGEAWFEGFAFALDADTDLNASSYQVIWQVRPDDDRGSPPAALEVLGGELRLTGGYNRPVDAYPNQPTTTNTYAYSITLLTGLRKQRWYHVVIMYGVWSALNSGRVIVWVDGTLLTNTVPPPGTNYPANGGQAYVKCGMYHYEVNRGATVYISDHEIGTTYASVDPSRAIDSYLGNDILVPRKQ